MYIEFAYWSHVVPENVMVVWLGLANDQPSLSVESTCWMELVLVPMDTTNWAPEGGTVLESKVQLVSATAAKSAFTSSFRA